MAKQIKITLKRSTNGRVPKHQKTIKALGLHHTNQFVTTTDTPQVRGMIKSVSFMVEVTDVNE